MNADTGSTADAIQRGVRSWCGFGPRSSCSFTTCPLSLADFDPLQVRALGVALASAASVAAGCFGVAFFLCALGRCIGFSASARSAANFPVSLSGVHFVNPDAASLTLSKPVCMGWLYRNVLLMSPTPASSAASFIALLNSRAIPLSRPTNCRPF